jgi:hypothetical protein
MPNPIETVSRGPSTAGSPLLIASDILVEEWWKGDGLRYWTERCVEHFGPIPVMPNDGQTVEAVVRDHMTLQYNRGMSSIAGAWFKVSLKCILGKPNYHIKLRH